MVFALELRCVDPGLVSSREKDFET